MLFLNYISDLWDDHVETYRKRYRGDEACIRRRLEPERFVMPEGASFRELYEQRNEPNIGELINIVLEDIEDRNRAKLEGSSATSPSTRRRISAGRRTATAV